MSAFRHLRNSWKPLITAIVLACFNDAVAQTSYKVTDLGREEGENAACAMSVNDEGWTEIMAWNGVPSQDIHFIAATLASGRVLIGADGFKFDLGTLGGKNSWMNWGDICGFGTHLTCRPFVWQFF